MFPFIPSKFSILPENTISSPGLCAWRNKCRIQLSHIGHLSVCRLSWEVCPDYQAVIRMTHLYELSIYYTAVSVESRQQSHTIRIQSSRFRRKCLHEIDESCK